MNQKNVLIGLLGLSLIILVIVGLITKIIRLRSNDSVQVQPSKSSFQMEELLELKRIKVPEPGEKPESVEVAIPKISVEAVPGVGSKFRSFNITADNDKYLPSKIIVNKNDIVHIDFTAKDKTYDLTIPDYSLSQTAAANEIKVIEFQAIKAGRFKFYCKTCQAKVEGILIVRP